MLGLIDAPVPVIFTVFFKINKLRILGIGIYPPKFSGAAFANAETIANLKEKGHKIIIVSDDPIIKLKIDDKYINSITRDIPVYRIEQNFPPAPKVPDLNTIKKISTALSKKIKLIIRQFQPHMILVLHESMCWYLSEWLYNLNIPSIIIFHG